MAGGAATAREFSNSEARRAATRGAACGRAANDAAAVRALSPAKKKDGGATPGTTVKKDVKKKTNKAKG